MRQVDQLQLRAGKVHRGRQHLHVGDRGIDNAGVERQPAQQTLIHVLGAITLIQAQSGGGVALWIQINHQHLLGASRQGSGQINGCGGFSHAAFLVGDGNDLRKWR